jgi:DNA repair protein RadD
MPHTLREYQKQAVSRMLWDMENAGNSILSMAQGSGKSHVIAEFAHRLNKPILILCPNKEILEQNINKMKNYVDEEEIGVFSASINRKDVPNIMKKFFFATIQSVYKHPELFLNFDVAIVDESDLIDPKHLLGMYNKFFRQANIKKCYGLTGTPFRQDTFYKEPTGGWIAWKKKRWKDYKALEVVTTTKMINRYKYKFWSRMLFVVNADELLRDGFLCPLEYDDRTLIKHEDIPINKSKSDFDIQAYEELIHEKEKKIIAGIQEMEKLHKSILVFCSSVDQANRMNKVFTNSSVVSSETKAKERECSVNDFKSGKTKIMFNCQVFSVGFDYPELSCVMITRPTRSLRWHLQVLGRGTRLAVGKTKCQIIDYSGNIRSLGKLEEIRVEKVDNLWNVTSPTFKSGFHNAELYSYTITQRKKAEDLVRQVFFHQDY